MRRTFVACALVIAALAHHSSPAAAAKSKSQQLTPSSYTTESGTGCGIAGSAAVCTSTGTPGSAGDPTMRAAVSVVDPVDPVPVAGGALAWARHTQVVTQKLTQAVRSVSYTWTFQVDEAFQGVDVGTRGYGTWSTELVVSAHVDDCDWTALPHMVIPLQQGTFTITAGTTYVDTWRFPPCEGMSRIPAGTTVTLTAQLYHSAVKHMENNAWDGRVDFTGALRSVSVTSTAA